MNNLVTASHFMFILFVLILILLTLSHVFTLNHKNLEEPNIKWWRRLTESSTMIEFSKEHKDFAGRFKSLDEFGNYFRFRLQDNYFHIATNTNKITVFKAIDNIIKGVW